MKRGLLSFFACRGEYRLVFIVINFFRACKNDNSALFICEFVEVSKIELPEFLIVCSLSFTAAFHYLQANRSTFRW